MKKVIIGIIGSAILGAAVTYYKTDNPQEALAVFVENVTKSINDVIKSIGHYF